MVTGSNVDDALDQSILRMGGVDANYKQAMLNGKATTRKNIGGQRAAPRGRCASIPKLPPGYTAGSTGAATCIGVIITTPKGQVDSYHFNAGTTAIIFGGDNSKESNFPIGSVVSHLTADAVNHNCSNTTGANDDSTGSYFLFLKDGLPPDQAATDPEINPTRASSGPLAGRQMIGEVGLMKLKRIRLNHVLWLMIPVALVFIYAARIAREMSAGGSSVCRSRLFAINIALLNYRDRNGRFPPAFLVDPVGKSAHSWRAYIATEIDGDFGRAYSFREP